LQQPLGAQRGGDGQATAAGAPLQQQQQQQHDEEQPRRRGRKPKDASTLTEKQLRAREAQKRFRDKQKRAMTETESAMGATVAEMERLRCVCGRLHGGVFVLLNGWPCDPLPTQPPS
jgi:exopolysaccharide biosynthesis predicted pyruvyltransferase EpsI